MGLDMFLYRVRKYKEDFSVEDAVNFISRNDYDSFEVGYWRKANEIHNYFIKYTHDNKDECGYSEITKENLEDLRDRCKVVMRSLEKSGTQSVKIQVGIGGRSNKPEPIYETIQVFKDTEIAEALLPTKGGFFFGRTDYSEYYLDDLKYTVELIDRILIRDDFENHIYLYHASW